MEMDDFTNEELSIEHADGCPAFFEMTQIGFTSKLYGTSLPSYEMAISYFSQGEVDYITTIKNQQEVGRNIVEQYLQDKNIIVSLHTKWMINYAVMMESYYQAFQEDFSGLSDAGLIQKSDRLFDFYANRVSMPGLVDGFMFYADKRLVSLVEEFCKQNGIADPIKIVSILTATVEPSFFNEEKSDLLELINVSRERYRSDDDLLEAVKNRSDEALDEALGKHLLKYSWIKSSYYGYKEYGYAEVIAELEGLIKNKEGSEADIFIKNKRGKESLSQKYGFTAEIAAIVELTDLLIKWQDHRKIYTLSYVVLRDKILREAARRKNIDFELLKYSLAGEMTGIFNGGFDLAELMERQRGCALLHSAGKLVEIRSGDEAIRFRAGLVKNNPGKASEIKGIVASLGKVTGVAKIVLSMKSLDKVNPGDILISPMTRPEHISAMKKAAAIVTDDGGITCHAAIVARELKIPCIIGTKIATQVLKDGDLVEVDAERGIVKIIKKA